MKNNRNTSSPLCLKSYSLAVEIVRFCREQQEKHKEYILSKQLLRSGTSVGANVEEATQSISRKEFIMKLTISLKEAHETRYWLRLFQDSYNEKFTEISKIMSSTNEVIRLLSSSIHTAKSRK